MEKLRIGIVGYGVIGKRRHHFINFNTTLNLVAICDEKFSELISSRGGINYYNNYHRLLECENLDALFVCVTNNVASEITISGLLNGLHVFCEKPPGKNVEDILSVKRVELSKPELKLKYGFNHRYHGSIKDVIKLIKEETLGTIINLKGVYGKSYISTSDSNWRADKEISGGGILLDQGIHMIDLMRLFAGDFIKYYSFIDNNFWNYEVEDNAYILMKSKSGAVAFLHSSATEWKHRFNLEITLTKGKLILDGILSGSSTYGEETLKIIKNNAKMIGVIEDEVIKYTNDDCWLSEINDFVDDIIDDRKVIDGSSNDALKAMEMVEEIYRADKLWFDKHGF